MTVLLPHLETMTWSPTSGPTYGSRCSKNANFLHFFLRSSSRVQPDLRPLCLLWRLHFGHILLLLTGVDHFHYCQYYFPKKKKTNLAPLLLIPTCCSPCKALWPGHKAPQDLTHCNFLFMPLLTCCPVPSRHQHSSSPNMHPSIFLTCLYLPLICNRLSFVIHEQIPIRPEDSFVKPATPDTGLLEHKA